MKIKQTLKLRQNQLSAPQTQRERERERGTGGGGLHEMFQNEDFVRSLSLYKHPILACKFATLDLGVFAPNKIDVHYA